MLPWGLAERLPRWRAFDGRRSPVAITVDQFSFTAGRHDRLGVRLGHVGRNAVEDGRPAPTDVEGPAERLAESRRARRAPRHARKREV